MIRKFLSPSTFTAFLLFTITITVIADDTELPVTSEVIRNGLGVPLSVFSNGTAGGSGAGGNLQFYEPGGIDFDCDSQAVYLYDLSPIIMYDAENYFWAPYYDINAHDYDHNFLPVISEFESGKGTSISGEFYLTPKFITPDSSLAMIKTWIAPADGTIPMIERWKIFSNDGLLHQDVRIGEWVDMNVPSDTAHHNNGTVVGESSYLYVSGQETDTEGCVVNDSRFYYSGLLGRYWTSEIAADFGVNDTTLFGAFVLQEDDLLSNPGELNPDSVWSYLNIDAFITNNSVWGNQQSLLSFGSFDIPPNDTLNIWITHGSILNRPVQDIPLRIAEAREYYLYYRTPFCCVTPCCFIYGDGITGNVDCSVDTKVNLSDITKLIDCIYVSELTIEECLCCDELANTTGDIEGKINLADITKLIDHVYISKQPLPPCQ